MFAVLDVSHGSRFVVVEAMSLLSELSSCVISFDSSMLCTDSIYITVSNTVYFFLFMTDNITGGKLNYCILVRNYIE